MSSHTVEKKTELEDDSVYTITITKVSSKGKREVIADYADCLGGYFIAHQPRTEDAQSGTVQGAYGSISSIILCMMKTPQMMEHIRNQFPDLKEEFEHQQALKDIFDRS